MLTCGLIVIDTNPVQLQIAVAMVGPRGINAMLIADHLPELRKMGVEGKDETKKQMVTEHRFNINESHLPPIAAHRMMSDG